MYACFLQAFCGKEAFIELASVDEDILYGYDLTLTGRNRKYPYYIDLTTNIHTLTEKILGGFSRKKAHFVVHMPQKVSELLEGYTGDCRK